MATPLYSKPATINITNASWTIQGIWGYKTVIIYPHATVDGYVTGSGTLGGTASSQIAIPAGGLPIIFESYQRDLDGIVITAPAGCTLRVVLSPENTSGV